MEKKYPNLQPAPIPGGAQTLCGMFDNREWLPDTPITVDVRVDARGVPAGEYDVAVGLFEGERPIKLAIKETALSDGFYTIGRTTVRSV